VRLALVFPSPSFSFLIGPHITEETPFKTEKLGYSFSVVGRRYL
jgi:hypothetical protein